MLPILTGSTLSLFCAFTISVGLGYYQICERYLLLWVDACRLQNVILFSASEQQKFATKNSFWLFFRDQFVIFWAAWFIYLTLDTIQRNFFLFKGVLFISRVNINCRKFLSVCWKGLLWLFVFAVLFCLFYLFRFDALKHGHHNSVYRNNNEAALNADHDWT